MASIFDRIKQVARGIKYQVSRGDKNLTFADAFRSDEERKRKQAAAQAQQRAQLQAAKVRQQQAAKQPKRSTSYKLTHNPVTNVVGGVVKPIPRFALNYSNTFANLGRKAAGLKPVTPSQQFTDPLTKRVTQAARPSGTVRQIAGDVANIGLSAAAPGTSKIVEQGVIKLAPSVVPKVITRAASKAAGGAVVGGVVGGPANVINTIAEDEKALTRENVLDSLKTGAAYGAAGGAVAPVAGAAVIRLGRGAVKLAQGTPQAVRLADQRLFTPASMRIPQEDRSVLSDYADYVMKRYRPQGAVTNELIRDARRIGQRLGIDVTSGSRADINQRIADALEAIDTSRAQVSQGGYVRLGNDNLDAERNRLADRLAKPIAERGLAIENAEAEQFIDEYADALQQMESGLSGGQRTGTGTRTSEHTNFYRDYYAENKRPPSKTAWREEAKRQLETGKADSFAQQEYDQIRTRQRDMVGLAGQPESYFAPDATVAYQLDDQTRDLAKPEVLQSEIGPKARRFSKNLKGDETIPADRLDEVLAAIPGYKPVGNKESFATAKSIVDTDPNTELARIIQLPKLVKKSDIAIAQLLLRQAIDAEDTGAAQVLAQKLGMSATDIAQSLQIYAAWKRTTPEGALRDLYNRVEKANQARRGGSKIAVDPVRQQEIAELSNAVKQAPKGSPERKAAQEALNRAKKETVPQGGIVVTPEKQKEIVELAKTVQSLPEGSRDRQVAEGLLEKAKDEVIPASRLQKISLVQTMAQLLNPKTFIRNIGGNIGFTGIRNMADVVAAGLDVPVSWATGKRSAVLPSLTTQAKGAVAGLGEGLQDVRLGIDTSPLNTQFDLPQGPVFQSRIGKAAEKGLGYALRVPDRAALEAAYRESLRNQLVAANRKGFVVTAPTPEMQEQAILEASEATFQDDNTLTAIFTGLKRALNVGKEFGLGDLVLKYPKTPASLLDKGIKYSPLGFVRTVIELARPVMGQAFDQREFVRSTAQAFTGSTALVGTGALLHRMGVLTSDPNEDKDLNQVEKLMGVGQYRINVSALKRLISSGFDPSEANIRDGDTLLSYDWFQPGAILVALGANVDQNKGEVSSLIGQLAAGVEEGANTLAEQPLVSGLGKLFQFGDLPKGVASVIGGLPSSFIPTLANQVSQFMDNTARETYDPDWLKQAINQAKAKIPGVNQTLPARVDIWGQEAERFQDGSNNLFNVFFNPAFVSRFKSNPESKLVMDIYDSIGETKQAPRMVDKSVTIDGEKRKLTPDEYTELQRYVGSATQKMFRDLADDEKFMALPDDEKADKLSALLTAIGQAGKADVLGVALPKNASKQAKSILKGDRSLKGAQGLPDGLSADSVDILTRYDDMTAEERRQFLDDGANEFAYKTAVFEKDKLDGKLSKTKEFSRLQELGKLQIQSKYPREVRDLYSLSKAQLQAYLEQNPTQKDAVNQMLALDKELAENGFISKAKYEDGIYSGSGGRSRRKKKDKLPNVPIPNFGSFGLVDGAPKLRTASATDVLRQFEAELGSIPTIGLSQAPESTSNIRIAL